MALHETKRLMARRPLAPHFGLLRQSAQQGILINFWCRQQYVMLLAGGPAWHDSSTDLEVAEELAQSCYELYRASPTGIGPDSAKWSPAQPMQLLAGSVRCSWLSLSKLQMRALHEHCAPG